MGDEQREAAEIPPKSQVKSKERLPLCPPGPDAVSISQGGSWVGWGGEGIGDPLSTSHFSSSP